MKTVCCLKTGDKYGPEYVIRLKNMVGRHLGDHDFICYTDDPVPNIECRPPPCDLPGWWGKLGFFRPGVITEPTLYLDLDMLVLDSLEALFSNSEFTTIRQWKRLTSVGTVPRFNTSAMYFPGRAPEGVWTDLSLGAMRFLRSDQDWVGLRVPFACTWPDEWFTPMEDCSDRPPLGPKLVVCNLIDNVTAAEKYAWVRDVWR